MDSNLTNINIQWFPGHMTKALRMMADNIKNVDAVCEIIDARIPYSSRNPEIDKLVASKPRIIIMNRADLADPIVTELWKQHFTALGNKVLVSDARNGKGLNRFEAEVCEMLSDLLEKYRTKGMEGKTLKLMTVGIPNVGKSTFINQIAKRKAAITGDKPGVTRGKQWIHVSDKIELMDTPGVLWPKFESTQMGEMLAVTHAVKQEILDVETLASNFIIRLRDLYPDAFYQRYKLNYEECFDLMGYELLEKAAAKRGFVLGKGEYDTERMATTVLKEYHDGKLGRLTLERPDGKS